LSNPALQSRSSVEVFFQVGYGNDGMYAYDSVKSPWGFYPTTGWSNDGDIATIEVESGESTFESTIPSALLLTMISSSFPNVFFRAKIKEAGSQYKYGVRYYDDTEEFSPYYGNEDWQTNSLRLSAIGKNIRSFKISVIGTIEADYFMFCGDTTPAYLTILPLKMDIKRAITDEIDTAEFTLDFPDYCNYDFLGSHIKVWLAKDTVITSSSFRKVFTGIVEHINKTVEGHEPRNLVLNANGYGSYLRRKVFKIGKSMAGYTHEVVRGIVEDLVEEGLVTTHHVYETSESFYYSTRQNKYASDALEELADKYDYDFYVDVGSDLHFWKRGTLESDLNIDIDETHEFPYEEDLESVINYQQVIGADVGTIGSDMLWCDQLSNWSASGNLSLDNQVVYSEAEGSVSLRNSVSNAMIWFERTLDPSEQDLSLGGVLTYALQVRANTSASGLSPKLKTRNMFISPKGTFTVVVESSGGLKSKRSLERYDAIPYPDYPGDDYYFWYYPFSVFEVPFNYKARTPPTKAGSTIDWSEIRTIRVEVIEPDTSSSEGIAWLDNFYIKDVYLSTIVSSYDSIVKYGRREGIPIGPDPELDTMDKVAFIGSVVVSVYKDPIRTVTDVKTLRGFDFQLGYEHTISVLEMQNVPLILRNIRHEVKGMDFNTYLTFTKRHIPSPEKLLAITKKQLRAYGWDIEAWKNARSPASVFDTRSEAIEFWEADLDFARAALVSSVFAVSVGDSTENYGVLNPTYVESFEVGGGGYYKVRIANSAGHLSGVKSKLRSLDGNNKIQFRFKAVPEIFSSTSENRHMIIGIYDPDTESGYHFYFEMPALETTGTLYFVVNNPGISTYNTVTIGTWASGNTYDCWCIVDPDVNRVHILLDEEHIDTVTDNIVSGTFHPFSVYGYTGEVTAGSIQVELYGYQVAYAW